MERYVEGGRLVERNVLTRPEQDDVVVIRYFTRADEDGAAAAATASPAGSKSSLVDTSSAGTAARTSAAEAAAVAEGDGAPQKEDAAIAEVFEITRQRRELIGLCGLLLAGGTYSCVRACCGRPA
jgi:hypothetical protein